MQWTFWLAYHVVNQSRFKKSDIGSLVCKSEFTSKNRGL